MASRKDDTGGLRRNEHKSLGGVGRGGERMMEWVVGGSDVLLFFGDAANLRSKMSHATRAFNG